MFNISPLTSRRAALGKLVIVLAASVVANACGDAARHLPTDPAKPAFAPLASRTLA